MADQQQGEKAAHDQTAPDGPGCFSELLTFFCIMTAMQAGWYAERHPSIPAALRNLPVWAKYAIYASVAGTLGLLLLSRWYVPKPGKPFRLVRMAILTGASTLLLGLLRADYPKYWPLGTIPFLLFMFAADRWLRRLERRRSEESACGRPSDGR